MSLLDKIRFNQLANHFKVYRNPAMENYCGVAMEAPKLQGNIGVLFRTCNVLGNVDFLATIGEKYNKENHWDPSDSHKCIPTWHFKDTDDFFNHIPLQCAVVGVELDPKRSVSLERFEHPRRAIYLFGNEGVGLSQPALKRCRYVVKLPSATGTSMNVSSVGSMILWDRYLKNARK